MRYMVGPQLNSNPCNILDSFAARKNAKKPFENKVKKYRE